MLGYGSIQNKLEVFLAQLVSALSCLQVHKIVFYHQSKKPNIPWLKCTMRNSEGLSWKINRSKNKFQRMLRFKINRLIQNPDMLSQGPFIMTSRKFYPKVSPSPSVILKWPNYQQLYRQCQKITYPPPPTCVTSFVNAPLVFLYSKTTC